MSNYFPFLFLAFLQTLHCVFSHQATLFEDINYDGSRFSVDIPVGKCHNVLDFNDRTSSLKTKECTRLWEHIDCTGRRIEMSSPGSDNLARRNFNDMVTSVSDCSVGGIYNGDKVEINMNTKYAPELKAFGRSVKKIMQDWFPFIQNLMTTTAYTPVKKIHVYFDPNYDGVAYASGAKIVGAVSYFKDNQDDYGAFIHEMTHVIQQANMCPGWLVEGYAEWTRRWFYEPWTAKDKPTADQSYKDGYTTAAWLMAYVNSAVSGKPVLYSLNKACQEGSWYDEIWQDLTGKTVDQLWQDMLNDKSYPWRK